MKNNWITSFLILIVLLLGLPKLIAAAAPYQSLITSSPTPLSPVFNITRLSPLSLAQALLTEDLQATAYSPYNILPVKEKISKLLAKRQDRSLKTLKENSENIQNAGILYIYNEDFLNSAKEFSRLYRTFERGEYLLYQALASSLVDPLRGKVEFNRYVRVAQLQGEAKVWYNLSRIILQTLATQKISDKKEFRALIKWFYEQYSFYTCYLILKIYEYYLPEEEYQEDWEFVHTLNVNLLIQSSNPTDAIAYIKNIENQRQAIPPKLLNKLAILYYKTDQLNHAEKTFARIDELKKIDGAITARAPVHFYYRALLHIKSNKIQAFKQTLTELQNSPAHPKKMTMINKLSRLITLANFIEKYSESKKKSLSPNLKAP